MSAQRGIVQEVPLDAIDVNPRQPRARFDDQAIQDLATSIRDRGVLQPILLRARGDDRFELIAGERRLRASRLAGLERVPALVKEANDSESLVLAIVENVLRADLTALEEARAYQALMAEFSLTQDEVARRVGKSRPAITNTLRLLQLPSEAQRDLEEGRITAGHARALLAAPTEAARSALSREIVTRGMSVRDAEKAVARTRTRHEIVGDPDVRRMESDLSRALGTKVSIHSGKDGKGTVEIAFFSHDDLGRVVAQLTSRKHLAHGAG
ncbi:ParB/RepB/Spo0J family partition protein [Candidatus Binatia bacterium]|nr:ParB/RepB/Spo0J family partition protein [Candidatus Binatia bacterium]